MDSSVYKRPSEPRMTEVKKRNQAPEMALDTIAQPLEVDVFTECHVTPADVASRMVEYLIDAEADFLTLEPHAGTGNLLQALFDVGHSVLETVAIERHAGLCKAVRQRFKGDKYIDPINRCFLEYVEECGHQAEFPRIIMNPPFKQVRKHMKAALSILGRGGHDSAVLVALVPVTYEHPEAETLEELPDTTFPSAKVKTKIIRVIR